jgi:hypothetical protein
MGRRPRGTRENEELRERFQAASVENLQLEKEPGHARVQLAQLRGEPYYLELTVDSVSLREGREPGSARLRPDLSGSGEFFLGSDMGPPAVLFYASLWDGGSRPVDLGEVLVAEALRP